MEKVTLKRGRGTVRLEKSGELIAVRPTPQAEVAEVLAAAPTEAAAVDIGTTIAGFRIVKLQNPEDRMETTLDELRLHHRVDAGSHVYHTPNSKAPIVPTGKITLRFTPHSTEEDRQRVLDDNHLELVDADVKDGASGARIHTFSGFGASGVVLTV